MPPLLGIFVILTFLNFFFPELRTELRALHFLGKCSTTELDSQSQLNSETSPKSYILNPNYYPYYYSIIIIIIIIVIVWDYETSFTSVEQYLEAICNVPSFQESTHCTRLTPRVISVKKTSCIPFNDCWNQDPGKLNAVSKISESSSMFAKIYKSGLACGAWVQVLLSSQQCSIGTIELAPFQC